MPTIPRCSIDVLVYLADKRRKRPIILEELFAEICEIFEQPIDRVRSTDRHRDVIICRYIYCFISKKMTGHKLLTIAGVMGCRDHSRVIHNAATLKSWLDSKDLLATNYWNKYLSESKLYRA